MESPKERRNWKSSVTKEQIFKIPNLLSFFRILLIPVIVYLYVYANQPAWTIAVITLSGITDVADGIIARKFNMITDFGKAIDPVADKLTQVAILTCLMVRFPLMTWLLVYMIIKEAVSLILRIIVFNRTDKVHGAEWHGKLNTVLLYLVSCVHVLWYNIPSEISMAFIFISLNMMIASSILYTVAMAVIISKTKKEGEVDDSILEKE